MMFVKLTAAALSIAIGATVAMAQTATTPAAPVAPKAPVAATTPAPTAPVAATAAKKGKAANLQKPRSAESLACSTEADTANVHGKKLRPAYMKKCIAGKMAAKKN